MATAVGSRCLFLSFLFTSTAAHAAHPLITEDTGTQGKGGFQLELSLERAIEDEHDLHEKAWLAAATLSYGLLDNLDVLVGGIYVHFHSQEADEEVREHGFGDATFDVKWRFFESGDFSVAFKPGVCFRPETRTRDWATETPATTCRWSCPGNRALGFPPAPGLVPESGFFSIGAVA